uniref:Leucine-rich repeats and IQ motif containing 3 n=1 Tax=Sinocyclocheilus grahami TaxID=75366 RepID=A0A672LKQ7_SINGR
MVLCYEKCFLSENGRDTFHKDIKMDSLEGYWAYLVNYLEDMLMVRLSSLLLKSLDQIGSCRALRICILADNFLTRIEALMECTHLVKLDLKGNQIVQLPDASCWSHLKELQLLYLHDNNMSTWNNIKGLLGCLNLTALTLSDTPLSLKKNYRHCLVNNIWSLKALDNFVISDEEIIQNWSLPFRFKAFYSPTLIIQRWIRGHLIRKSLG